MPKPLLIAAVLSALPLLSLTRETASQPNPLTNGGFEELDAAGQPVGWSVICEGSIETADVHSGQRALRLRNRGDWSGDPGLNRAWDQGSGRQGGMLAERKGGLRFWYKAFSAEPADGLKFVVIPMNGVPLEVGGGRTMWTVPAEHVGDGQWHQGAFAYSYEAKADVRWVHVGLRLYARNVDLLVDEFEWVPQVGPVLQAGDLALAETPGREGAECEVTLTVRNVGDAPLAEGSALLALPAGLTARENPIALPAVAPGEAAPVAWVVSGERQRPDTLTATVTAADQKSSAALTLGAKLASIALRLDRSVVRPGQSLIVRLLARNAGTAVLARPRATLTPPPDTTVEALPAEGRVMPGTEGEVARWRLTPGKPTSLARLAARVEGFDGEATSRFMACSAMPRSLPDTGEAYAGERGGQVVIGSSKARLILARQAEGYGVGMLQTRTAKGWRTLAILPRLGLLATETTEVALAADHVTAHADARGARLALEGAAKADGVSWTLRWDLTVAAGADTITYALQATPDKPAAIRALEGPMLYAGEGGRPAREDAIVPGIEWLVKGEQSSGVLDFLPDHPDRLRQVPHPYKITVPAVGMRLGDSLLGLLWDVPQRQPSFAQAGPATLVFSSPNTLEGQDNHLLGLLLPAVGDFLPENATRAEKPLPLAAGQTLQLCAQVMASPAAPDALAVLDRWYAEHGYPQPLPYPRGDRRAEVGFSLRGYFKDRALWNPEWKAWFSDLIVGFRPDKGPARDLLYGARVLGSGPVADEARALAAEVLGGDERSRDLSLEHRADPGGLGGLGSRARSLIASQHADGAWRFSGDKAGDWSPEHPNYKVLGPVGASEVGLTAPSASQVLDYALLTGDPRASAAGLQALAAMRRFRVPRAAQVWECPVHSPDIFASAVAVEACLRGYRLTGDQAYLRDAVYWARTGLPFVYVWSPPDQPAMQGASIPIFGATGYGLSWLAVAVQWNGLAYANALLDLAEYDESFPWRRVAENLLRSAMYQQATEGDRLAQWPDALNFIADRPGPHGTTPPCFQPATVVRMNLALMGECLDPQVAVVRQGKDRLALRATARFADLSWSGGTLRFTAAFPHSQWGAIEVIGVTKPQAVLLEGSPLPEVADPQQAPGPAWTWYEGASLLEARVTRPGAARLEVRGASPAPVRAAQRDLSFTFDRGTEGWVAANHLAPLTASEGLLRTETTGPDPYMVRDGLAVPGRAGDVLVIRVASNANGAGSVYFATEAGGVSEERNIPLRFPPDGEWHEVRLPVGDHPGWAGHTITVLRLDPAGGADGWVRIDSLRLERAR